MSTSHDPYAQEPAAEPAAEYAHEPQHEPAAEPASATKGGGQDEFLVRPRVATEGSTDSTPAASTNPRSFKQLALAAVAVAALTFGGFALFGGSNSDDLSQEQIQARQQNFTQAVLAGRATLPTFNLSDPSQVAAAKSAIVAMDVGQDVKQAMVAQVEQQAQTAPQDRTVEYVVFQAYDNCVVDGDTIRFRAPGLPDTTLVLDHNYKTVVIPKPVGQPMTVKIIGVHDGGGGITAGINTVNGPLAIPVLTEGDTIPLTIN